jgi:hypothetical protein
MNAAFLRRTNLSTAACEFLGTPHPASREVPRPTSYSAGDRMMLNNAMSGWMVEGSPSRLLRDYNQLVDAYNRGPNI